MEQDLEDSTWTLFPSEIKTTCVTKGKQTDLGAVASSLTPEKNQDLPVELCSGLCVLMLMTLV